MPKYARPSVLRDHIHSLIRPRRRKTDKKGRISQGELQTQSSQGRSEGQISTPCSTRSSTGSLSEDELSSEDSLLDDIEFSDGAPLRPDARDDIEEDVSDSMHMRHSLTTFEDSIEGELDEHDRLSALPFDPIEDDELPSLHRESESLSVAPQMTLLVDTSLEHNDEQVGSQEAGRIMALDREDTRRGDALSSQDAHADTHICLDDDSRQPSVVPPNVSFQQAFVEQPASQVATASPHHTESHQNRIRQRHVARLHRERNHARQAIANLTAKFLDDLEKLHNGVAENGHQAVSGETSPDVAQATSMSLNGAGLEQTSTLVSVSMSDQISHVSGRGEAAMDQAATEDLPSLGVSSGHEDDTAEERSRKKIVVNPAMFSLASDDVPTDQSSHSGQTLHSFPCRSPETSNRLARLFRVLEELFCALTAGRNVTKRDIYYRSPALFGRQATVDRIVDQLSVAFGVRRSALGVVAAAKGLVAGTGKIHIISTRPELPDGPSSNPSVPSLDATEDGPILLSDNHAVLIPDVDIVDRIETTAKWCIIVEKEAVFKTLLSADLSRELTHGILVTGKGFPDLITRDFIARVAEEHPSMQLFALVDGDPYGLDIFEKYRTSLTTKISQPDRLLLLGMTSEDVQEIFGDTRLDGEAITDGSPHQDAIPLTRGDIKRANNMLLSPDATAAGSTQATTTSVAEVTRFELSQMLTRGHKFELEAISTAARRLDGSSSAANGDARLPTQRTLQDAGIAEDGLISYVRSKLQKVLV